MNVGVCSWAFHGVLRGRDPYDLVERAERAGFAGIEAAFRLRGGRPDPSERTPIRGVRSLATLELHRHELCDLRPERRAQAWHTLDTMIDTAAALATPTVSLSPGRTHDALDLTDLAKRLESRAARAKESGVVLCIENLPHRIGGTLAEMSNLLLHVPSGRICLDIGNAVCDPPVVGWLAAFDGAIEKVHLSDGVSQGTTFGPKPLGTGDVPWPDVAAYLRDREVSEVFVEAPLPAGVDEMSFLHTLRADVERCLGSRA
jgi:sugar phosphate isomerase/epimerase